MVLCRILLLFVGYDVLFMVSNKLLSGLTVVTMILQFTIRSKVLIS
jgi:hypothetical protein